MVESEGLAGKSPEPKRIFVAGVTGKQGGTLARLLVKRGHKIHGLTRKPEGPAATALRHLGVEIHAGDLEEARSVESTAKGCDAAYIVATPYEKGTEYETRVAITAMNAARSAGVPYIVYSSVSDADRSTGIPHFESKALAEKHLRGMGGDYSIVAPVFFTDNLAMPWMAPGLANGVLAMALPGNRKLQVISVRDVAGFSALAVEHRDQFRGKRVNIAGDELTPIEMATQLTEVIGRRIASQEIPLDVIRQQSEDSAKMFDWFNRVGYSAELPRLRRDYPQVGWQTFRAWSGQQDWKKMLSSAPTSRP